MPTSYRVALRPHRTSDVRRRFPLGLRQFQPAEAIRVNINVGQIADYCRPRFETQSGPPDDDGRQCDSCGKVDSQLVVACGDTAEILEPTEHALDKIALLVGGRIKGVEAFPCRIVRDHRQSAALDQKLT